jgi:hypothetical protein
MCFIGRTPNWVHVIPCPDLYRGKYRDNDSMATHKYCQDATNIIKAAGKDEKKV